MLDKGKSGMQLSACRFYYSHFRIYFRKKFVKSIILGQLVQIVPPESQEMEEVWSLRR